MSQLLAPSIVPQLPKPDAPSLPEGIAASINSEWITSWLFKRAENQAIYTPDPFYDPWANGGKVWGELTADLDPDYWPSLGEATSIGQALKMREQLMGVQKSRTTLSQMGWTGTALQIGANFIDPVNLATMLIPGVGEASLGAKGGRLAFAVKSGLAAGIPNAALEGLRALEDPLYGPRQAVTAGLSGFGFGAGLASAAGKGRAVSAFYAGAGQAAGTAAGTLTDEDMTIREALWSIGISGVLGAPFGAFSSRMHREMELDAIKQVGGTVNEDSRAYFKGIEENRVSDVQTSVQNEIDTAIEVPAMKRRGEVFVGDDAPLGTNSYQIDNADASTAKPVPTKDETGEVVGAAATEAPGGSQPTDTVTAGGGAGAATRGVIELNRFADDERYDPNLTLTEAPSIFSRIRVGMAGIFGRITTHPLIRAAASGVFEDVLPKADGSPSLDATESVVRRTVDRFKTEYIRKSANHVDAWLKSKGISYMGRADAVDELFDEVGRAQRRFDPHPDPNVAALVEIQRDAIMRTWAYAYRNGVPGFDKFSPNDLYLTRIWSLPAINRAIEKYGQNAVIDTIAESIQRQQKDLTPREAGVVAKSMLKDIMAAKTGLGLEASLKYNTDSREALGAILRENVSGVTDEEIASILNKLKREGGGVHKRAEYRVRLDETFVSGNVAMGIEDLLENNAYHVFERYTRELVGAGAVAEYLRAYSRHIGRPDDNPIRTIDGFRADLSKRVRDTYLGNKPAADKASGQIDTLAHMLSHLRGAPLNTGKRADFLRMMRKVQFSRVMNFAGLAQIPDVANVITQAGFKTVVNAIPNLKSMFSKAADGLLSNEAAREAEALFAHEAGTLSGSVVERFDWAEYQGGRAGKFERILDKANNVTKKVSLLDGMNTMLHRTVGVLAEQKWFDIAKSGKLPNKQRLAAMGLDEAMAKRIIGQINKYAENVDGTRAVKVLNPGSWDDMEAASALVTAMDKWSRRTVQASDLGQMSAWMTTDIGKTVIQFRSFMVSAYEKQLLYPIATRDWEAFASWGTTMFFGGLAYVGATYAQSWGKPEREKREFLKRQLSTQAIGMAAFNRAGWSSVIPMIWDTQAAATGAPKFANSRMTGLGGDPITGNPTADFMYSLMYRAPKALAQPAIERREPTQGEARTVASLLPFQNAIGIRNVLNAVVGELPERER